jgi:hypothetical protein
MLAAAPRYAETPTPSRTLAKATKDFTSVDGKAYVHSLTAASPSALVRKPTCVVSSYEIS